MAKLGEERWVTYSYYLITPFNHIALPDACSRSLYRVGVSPTAAKKSKFFSLIFLHFTDLLTLPSVIF